ncbi:hypothetical protein PINS_up010366 [Pythium insidiosum]|nr:hypothetical protein PINS_up010366 [Pythium insidiosum]
MDVRSNPCFQESTPPGCFLRRSCKDCLRVPVHTIPFRRSAKLIPYVLRQSCALNQIGECVLLTELDTSNTSDFRIAQEKNLTMATSNETVLTTPKAWNVDGVTTLQQESNHRQSLLCWDGELRWRRCV